MTVSVLIDNNPHPCLDLLTEHGLSIYFETDGYKWLFDVGASDGFYLNAERTGINVEDVDYLVISHGHYDHAGGLKKFLTVNHKARIVMTANIRGKQFYSDRMHPKRNISIDQSIVDQNINRFMLAADNMQISKNVALICRFPEIHPGPMANIHLTIEDQDGEKPDKFRHEAAVVVKTPAGLVVFSGCSHSGILNILDACSDWFGKSTVIACIGGTHLPDKNLSNTYESEAGIKETGRLIKMHYPGMKLITGHCTGIDAQRYLSLVMGDRFQTFHSGFNVNFE
jgi:7,8-dihydropterin-6-yl-methyl-4-(beta-D-ribofuranosyl)aminobenzene 5'-phosphate synthase